MKIRRLGLVTAVSFASLAGCFATSPDTFDNPWGTPPNTEPPVTGALTIDDLAVTTEGNLLALAYDYNSWSGGQVVQLLDPDLNVISSVTLPPSVYAMSIGPLSGNRAIVSDGYLGVSVIDLDTGSVTSATGYEAIANGPAGFLAATVADSGGNGEVFNIPCEDPGDWNMDVFDADDADGDGVLLATVDLDNTGLSGTTDITAGNGMIFVLGYEAPVAIDASTGAVIQTFGQDMLFDVSAWAYDATRDGLWIVSYSGSLTFLAL